MFFQLHVGGSRSPRRLSRSQVGFVAASVVVVIAGTGLSTHGARSNWAAPQHHTKSEKHERYHERPKGGAQPCPDDGQPTGRGHRDRKQWQPTAHQR